MFFDNFKINKLLYISNLFPKQGTAEWINLREWFISGTKVTAIKKGKYYFQIFKSKVFTGNKYTRHGHYYEDIARKKYEIETRGCVIELNFITHATHKNIGFSPDGYDINNDCLIEIKCPYSSDLTSNLKTDHYDQIQLGLLVLHTQGIDTCCKYVVYEYESDKITIRNVNRDPTWYPSLEADVDKYFKAYREFKLENDKLFYINKDG